ncbi:MAG: site-2 protease family protein [Chloroflexi bacterium]|nr:site-2 protease family protein [Chloroflexota bacterium]
MDLITQSLLPFVGILLGLVVIHEAGHYVTAKLFGVKVLEAGIGFPPRVWGFRWHDTDYTLNLLPLGAFVRMLGEEDPTDPQSLAAQVKWKRTVIIGAGAFMNLVLAIVLFSIGLMIPHKVSQGGAAIASVAPNTPAQAAGLQAGDEILKVNGRKAESIQDASYLIRLYQGGNVDFTLKRKDPRTGDSQIIDKNVYARWNPQPYADECGVKQPTGPTGITIQALSVLPISRTSEDRAKLLEQSKRDFTEYKGQIAPGAPAVCNNGTGFGFKPLTAAACSDLDPQSAAEAQALKAELFAGTDFPCYVFSPPPAFEIKTTSRSEPPWRAVPRGGRLAFESIILTRNQIWSLARGFGGSPITGPVGIAQVTGEVVKQAGWLQLINLAGSISMSLALVNILPLPMVDGGRLVFILIEFLRRGRRVAPEKEALVHFAGFVAMLLFAAVVTYFDIARIIGGGSPLR